MYNSGTNRSKNKLWDKSFQKQTLGQIVPKNKKRPNKFSPPSPLKKKGAGRAPREAAQLIDPGKIWAGRGVF